MHELLHDGPLYELYLRMDISTENTKSRVHIHLLAACCRISHPLQTPVSGLVTPKSLLQAIVSQWEISLGICNPYAILIGI